MFKLIVIDSDCYDGVVYEAYHAFPVIDPRQIFLKFLADLEFHIVVLEGAERLNSDVIAVLGDVLVRFQQNGDFPDSYIYICSNGIKSEELVIFMCCISYCLRNFTNMGKVCPCFGLSAEST